MTGSVPGDRRGPVAADARRGFTEQFGRTPTVVVTAPGRVNLIGDHTDYNDGFVLPMAIDAHLAVAADRSGTQAFTAHSSQTGETVRFEPDAGCDDGWGRYVAGAVAVAADAGLACDGGLDLWIASQVPVGAGLSSSAALSVAVLTAIESLTGRSLDVPEKARLCQRVEHDHAGVRCGIMDPYVICAARRDHAMRLDCRSLEVEHVAVDPAHIAVLIADTRTDRQLAGGVYGERRAECELAAMLVGVSSLRDVTHDDLVAWEGRMPTTLFRRMRHVVSENERTVDAAAALACGDWPRFGRRMNESHDSLRDDFEVSTAELDTMVALGRELGALSLGSRMTGGGMGGCTVSLVPRENADEVARHLADGYEKRTGITPTVRVTRAVDGAHLLDRE